METSYTIKELGILITVYGSPGELTGDMVFDADPENDVNDPEIIDAEIDDDLLSRIEYNAGKQAIGSLLLALACEGFDLKDERMQNAIYTACDSLANET